jgi:Na+/pantothenate symporter
VKVGIGIVLLLAALAGGGGVLLEEDQGIEFTCCLVIFAAGIGYGLLAGSKR